MSSDSPALTRISTELGTHPKIDLAARESQRIESPLTRYPNTASVQEAINEEFRKTYSLHAKEVVKLTNPQSPPKCATEQWQRLHEAAILAEARHDQL